MAAALLQKDFQLISGQDGAVFSEQKGFSIFGMVDTGGFFQGATPMEAFADCDAVRALVTSAFVALLFTFVLYMVRGVMDSRSFMKYIPNGLKTMCGPMIFLILAWNLSGIMQLPYALTAAGVSAVGFLLAGILGTNSGIFATLIVTPVTFVLIILVLLGIRRFQPSAQ